HPDDQQYRGAIALRGRLEGAVQVRFERPDQLVGEQRLQLRRAARAQHARPLPEPLDQYAGRLHADVRGDQRLLQPLPRLLVEPVAREQGEQALAKDVLRAGKPGAEPDQPAGGGRRLLDLDLWLRLDLYGSLDLYRRRNLGLRRLRRDLGLRL